MRTNATTIAGPRRMRRAMGDGAAKHQLSQTQNFPHREGAKRGLTPV
jgi:hypothetical protein